MAWRIGALAHLLWWLCLTKCTVPVDGRPSRQRPSHSSSKSHPQHIPLARSAIRRFQPISTKEDSFLLCSETNNQHPTTPRSQTQNLLDKTRQAGANIQQHIAKQPWKQMIRPLMASSGGYYGMTNDMVHKLTAARPKPKDMRETISETLDEVRSMRHEMEALRRELQEMRRQVLGADNAIMDQQETEEQRIARNIKRQKRKLRFDELAKEIEQWSSRILFDTPDTDDTWSRIECHKTFKPKGERTQAYLSWMKDSRGKYANPDDDVEYPCLRMYSTIDAPLDTVCYYLAQPDRMSEYNHLLEECQDLEEISSNSKVCLGETPQILFVKPREFVTFCSHRWLADGSLVIVNQAVDDEEYTSKTKQRPRAYAFRGANYIRRHPDDPEKTRICMLAHGSPGNDVPVWAMKTAVRTLVAIEPFKLFHKINEGVRQALPMLEQHQQQKRAAQADIATPVSTEAISTRPAGISQLGYACFWPNGGGVQETPQAPLVVTTDESVDVAVEQPQATPLSTASADPIMATGESLP